MPLVAHLNGSRTEAHQLSADEWAILKSVYKQRTLTMTCGQLGVPKTSKLGFQYFAHKPGADCTLHAGGPESAEHLALKAAVEGCGWTAALEYAGPQRGWIADVLAEKEGRRVARSGALHSLPVRPWSVNVFSDDTPRATRAFFWAVTSWSFVDTPAYPMSVTFGDKWRRFHSAIWRTVQPGSGSLTGHRPRIE